LTVTAAASTAVTAKEEIDAKAMFFYFFLRNNVMTLAAENVDYAATIIHWDT
jgi:hypothetical protein